MIHTSNQPIVFGDLLVFGGGGGGGGAAFKPLGGVRDAGMCRFVVGVGLAPKCQLLRGRSSRVS